MPVVIAPGGLDCIVFNSIADVPFKLRRRKIYYHDIRVAVRTSKEELRKIAMTIARRIASPKGPVGVLIPIRGWSEADKEGALLFDPEAPHFFTRTLKSQLAPEVTLREVDFHISDHEFVREAVAWLDEMTRG